MIEKLKRNIFLTIILAVFVFLILFFLSDVDQIIESLSNFSLDSLAIVIGLSSFSIVIKFYRWHYLIKHLNISISAVDSLMFFLSGLIMSMSPGKLGELIKSYLIRKKYNIPVSKTAPIIFAERITEFISLLIFVIIGIILYDQSILLISLIGVFLIVIILVMKNKKFRDPVFNNLIKLPILKNYSETITELWMSSKSLLGIKSFSFMLLVSLAAWIFESFCFYIILRSFINNVSVLWASFTYAFSIILGAISMLPGGIGATEGSLTYLLVQNGFSSSSAVASTILMRSVTLWFSVIIGIFSLIILFWNKEFRSLNDFDKDGN